MNRKLKYLLAGLALTPWPLMAQVNQTPLAPRTTVDLTVTDDEPVYYEKPKSGRVQRINRDIMKATFIPKGQWMAGGTVS